MTAQMLYCGIDPGLTGAIGLVQADGRFHAVHDMPVLTSTTGRKQVDFAALAALLREYQPTFTMVERVGARPGEGAVGGFAFGMTFGGILAMLATMALPHDIVQPATWKRKAGIPPGADKAVSIQTALRLLPSSASMLTRKRDDGRAESLLLAIQSWEKRRGAPGHFP